MKRNVKGLFAIGLSLVMLFSLITGCSQGEPAEASKSGETQQSMETSATETSKAEEPVDLGGMEIVFAGLTGFYLPDNKESEDYELAVQWMEEVEKKFNCKIRVDVHTPWDTYAQKIQDMTMAGEVIGDIIHFDSYIYPKVMITGLLMPLQDYINVKDYDFWEQEIEQYFDYKGNIYGLSAKTAGIPSAFMMYNKTLFAEKGLDAKYDLMQLVKDKQWTWEKFREVLLDSTIEAGNDGGKKIWGLSGQGLQFGRLSNYFVRANDAVYTKKVGDMVEFTAEDPEFIKALEFLNQLVWQDKVISDEPVWRGYESMALFAKGGSMFFAGTNWWISSLKAMVPDGTEIGILPIPIGPDAGGEYINFNESATIYGMPSTTKHAKEAGMVFEYWLKNSPKSEKTIRDHWAEMVFDIDSLDVIEMLSKLPRKIEFSTSGYTNLNNFQFGEHGIGDRVPPATFIQESKDPIMTEIKQMWSLSESN